MRGRVRIGLVVVLAIYALGAYGLMSILVAAATEDRCSTTTRPVPPEVWGGRTDRSLLLAVRWTCIDRDRHGDEVGRRTMWLWSD